MKLLFAISLLVTTTAFADGDKEKFRNEITMDFDLIMCDQSYLECLNRRKSECNISVSNAIQSCSIDAAYKASTDTIEDEKKAYEKFKIESVKYGDCVADHFFKNLNIDKKTKIKCDSSFPLRNVDK